MARITVVVFTLFITFGQRYTIGAATGGRGAVQPLEMLFIACSLILWLAMACRPSKSAARYIWWPTVGPLFSLLLVMPFLGVLMGGYDLRTLYSYVVVLVPVSILVLGQAARRYGVDLRPAAFAAIIAHGLYGIGQMLYRLGLMPEAAWAWAVQRDAQSQAVFGDSYLVSGRSTGLFLNANEFGIWSVLALVFGAVYLRGSYRMISVLLGILGVISSQSRTASVVLALLAAGFLMAMLTIPRLAKRALPPLFMTLGFVALLTFLGMASRLVEIEAIARLSSGLEVLTQGVQADTDLASRYSVWSRAVQFTTEHPFGTLGPPQVKFDGGSLDSQFVSLYVQGSVVLVLAYLLALFGPYLLIRRGVPHARAIALMTGTFAVFSYTALPLDSTMGSSLLWVAVALSISWWADETQISSEDHDSTIARSGPLPLPNSRASSW